MLKALMFFVKNYYVFIFSKARMLKKFSSTTVNRLRLFNYDVNAGD